MDTPPFHLPKPGHTDQVPAAGTQATVILKGYGEGKRLGFPGPAGEGTNGRSSASAVNRPTKPPHRAKGRFPAALLLLAVCVCGGYQVWSMFFRYRAHGVVVGRVIDISPPWDGTLMSVEVEEGDYVAEGDALFQVENQILAMQIAATHDELNTAKARLESEQARLRWQASHNIEEYQEAKAEYHEACAGLQAEQAKLNELKAIRQRAEACFERGAVTAAEREQAAFQLQGQQSKVAQLIQAVADRKRSVDGAIGLTEAGQDQLKECEATIERVRAKLGRLKELIARARVEAPTGGQVLRQLRYPGENVAAAGPVLKLIEDESMEIVIFLGQKQSRTVRPNDSFDVFVRPRSEPVPCRVVRVGTQYQRAPDQIKRYYRADEMLLPVFLKPCRQYPELLPGATVELPCQ